MFAAKSLDPPLRERRHPHHHYPTTPPPTPAASAQSAGDRPTALITAVSKPDSVIFINPSTRDLHAKVPELTFSPNAVPPSWRKWRPCLCHTTYQPTIVAFEESADSGPTAQGATVSKTLLLEKMFLQRYKKERQLHLSPRTVPSLLIIKRGPHWSLFLLKSLKPLCCQKMNMN